MGNFLQYTTCALLSPLSLYVNLTFTPKLCHRCKYLHCPRAIYNTIGFVYKTVRCNARTPVCIISKLCDYLTF